MSDSGEVQPTAQPGSQPGSDQARRPPAASVSNRWWETESTGHPAAGRPGPVPPSNPLWQAPPPPPPHTLELPLRAALPPAVEEEMVPGARERRHLELELEAARAEIAALHEMLEDLPEIFERKFRQRVQSLIEEQQRLLADNQLLRDRLYALTPATSTTTAQPATPPLALPSFGSFPALGQRPRLRRTLRDALDSLRRHAGGKAEASLSGPDDERTTAA